LGFARGVTSPAALPVLLLAAALFLRGFAIILRVRRERERRQRITKEEEEGEVGGQLWWPLEVGVLKMRRGRDCAGSGLVMGRQN
jgi:hypothetical protein